jgi:hypothetical protein
MDVLRQFSQTWGQALATILMTSMATNLPNVTPQVVLDHCISDWFAFAAIQKKNGKVRVLPNGIGFGAWCKAANNKNSLRQINFAQPDKNYANEFEVLGWQFTSPKEKTNLLVNFTASQIKIDVTALTTNEYCNLEYAGKNKIINSWQDISVEKRKIENNIILLPPYSIGLISN